jgi:predicted ATP-dependent serine protease
MQILAENQAKLMENQALIMQSMVNLAKRVEVGINEARFENEARTICRKLEDINDLIEDGIFAIDPH